MKQKYTIINWMKYKQLRASIMFGHTLCYNRLGKVTLNRTWTSDQVQILKKMETKFLPIINIWVLFRRSTTANSVVESPIWLKFEVDAILDIMQPLLPPF